MDDQQGEPRRVRRILPPDQAARQPQPTERTVISKGENRHETGVPARNTPVIRSAAPPPPQRNLYQYVIGAVVSATVLGLLLVIVLFATAGKSVPGPASNTNTGNISGDVPTVQVPVSYGTLIPGEVPTSNLVVPPAQPSLGPAGQGWPALPETR
jgi:hypothetical protein